MGFFENDVYETTLADGRRLVTRCNPARRAELATARQGFKTKLEAWAAAATDYLKNHPKAKPATQFKHGNERLKRGKLNAWISLEIKDRQLILNENADALKEHAKLDGCYAIVSDLPAETADKQTLHDRYKDLAKVESDFRTLKHGHLEIRPWYVQNEPTTRAHALTAMLALKIRRRLAAAWTPLNKTVEEGLSELQALSVIEIYDKESGALVSRELPEPSASQAQLLSAAGVKLPKKIAPAGPPVVTRVKLEKRRKSPANP
jgi:transposase